MVTEREQELLEENARLRQQNELLRQKVDLLVKRIFGAGSEKLDPRQLELLLEGSSPGKANEPDLAAEATRRSKEESTPRSKSKPAKNKWPRLPAHLPCVEELVDPLPVQAEPQAWRCIGQEVSEQLDYEPARFLRRRMIRRKYVKRGELDAVPVIAPLPPVLQERCIAAPGLLAQVIVAKYCDHLPLHRQERIYATRHQVILPRQTLARWMGLAADWLGLIYREINAGVVKGGYIQMDETPVRYLDPGNKKTGTGYLWVCNRPGGEVVYHWRTSRAAECVGEILPAHWRGVLQCDGYAGYRSYARSAGREGHIRLAACYAHARRKFIESQSQAPCIVTWLLRQMAHLYQIEKYLRQERAGPRLREALRAAQSHPIHERIGKALVRLKTKKRYLPKSSMGKAIDYALGQWPGLSVFLQDGRVEIDNNLVENAIRPTAVGKKNWLFVGDADAGQRGAVLYTVIENCRRNGVDPYAYLREILTKLPVLTNQNIATWIPAAYAKRLREERYPQAAAS
ncbi:MAG: IS66 family transposase [Chthoniobacteraceae bacterium]